MVPLPRTRAQGTSRSRKLVVSIAWPCLIVALCLRLSTAWIGQLASPRPRHSVARRALDTSAPLKSLKVAIVGAGPSGLLLAHRLLDAGASVEILEGRGDPRGADTEGRAYALGLGIRGRTAIRTVDNELWSAINTEGFGSERFKLHLPFGVIDLRSPDDNAGLEPSLLVYQSDLCGAMLTELESRHAASGRLRTTFQASASAVDPYVGTVALETAEGQRTIGPMDVVAGCDGVNSVVRAALEKACARFKTDKTELPGFLKVLRFPKMPEALAPDAVHAIPGAGGSSAFMEPTARGACALINWRSATDDDKEKKVDLGDVDDAEVALEMLRERFPILDDQLNLEAGQQFVAQKAVKASTIRCNTYHHGVGVLLGDAAHSTGGASGQGCNSALQDSAALADCLLRHPGDVPAALLAYSKSRVPEGRALLDLSLGPGDNASPVQRILYGATSLRDALLSKFGLGEPPLQTQLTTTLTPFSEIRRKRDFFFGEFTPQSELDAAIEEMAATAKAPEYS